MQTLSVSVSDVEPGSTYSVALAVDGVAVKAWDAQSAPDTFSFDWEGDAGTAHNAVFTITSSLGGQDWVSSRAVNFTVGETVAVLGSVSALDSMVFRVGDRVVLPALEWGESIAYDTNVVVSLSGATFTALEPGASRVRRFATDLVTGVATEAESGVMIVAPRDEDLNGAGLFVNRTAANGTINWCNASSWQKISGPDGKDWPDGPGDVALIYLPLTQYTVTVNFGNNAVTVQSYDIAFGVNSHASGARSIAIGVSSDADGFRSIAFGNNAKAVQSYDLAIGISADASGGNAVALGYDSHAQGFSHSYD